MRRNMFGRILQKAGGMVRGGATNRSAGATRTGTTTRSGGGLGSMLRRFLR